MLAREQTACFVQECGFFRGRAPIKWILGANSAIREESWSAEVRLPPCKAALGVPHSRKFRRPEQIPGPPSLQTLVLEPEILTRLTTLTLQRSDKCLPAARQEFPECGSLSLSRPLDAVVVDNLVAPFCQFLSHGHLTCMVRLTAQFDAALNSAHRRPACCRWRDAPHPYRPGRACP